MNQPCILVVESENEDQRRISAWLEHACYTDVMFCPGPSEPEYTCLGGRGAACPLSKAADIVVVDMNLRSDEAMRGTPAWQLMLHYYEQGKRIIVLSGAGDVVHPWADDQVHVVERPIEREPFLAAIRSFETVAVGGA